MMNADMIEMNKVLLQQFENPKNNNHNHYQNQNKTEYIPQQHKYLD